MTTNRSVPTSTILPHIVYTDVAAAITWLARSFGFVEHYRFGSPGPAGSVEGAQMHLNNAWIMLTRARPGRASPLQVGCRTQSLTVFVDDVDAHFNRASAAHAKIIEQLNDTVYGERQYAAEDLEGHHWLLSQHVRDVAPEEWGALTAAQPAP